MEPGIFGFWILTKMLLTCLIAALLQTVSPWHGHITPGAHLAVSLVPEMPQTGIFSLQGLPPQILPFLGTQECSLGMSEINTFI